MTPTEYFHVRVIRKSEPNAFSSYRLDLSRHELETRILEPYRAGGTLTMRGTPIPSDDIKQVLVTTTEEPSEVLMPQVEADMNAHKVRIYAPLEWYVASRGVDVTENFVTGPPGDMAGVRGSSQSSSHPPNPTSVFVVHGRDSKVRDSVFQFLRTIGLRPIEWGSARSATRKSTPYVGEILDKAFEMAQAIVVIMTPDDEARLASHFLQLNDPQHERELTGQARPNVLFEAGMAMGRDPDRTVLVEIGDLRPFSDIGGRHVLRLDNSTRRRQEFAQRLETTGCVVDLNGTDWHDVGDFSPSAGGQ